jgi:hypothetical protein
MGLDPEDEKNYTNTTVLDNASNYLQKILMVTAPTSSSDKPNVQLLQYQRGLNNDAQSQNNFVKTFNQKQKENDDKSEGGGKVTITTKEGPFGDEKTVRETLLKSDYLKAEANKANAEANMKNFNKPYSESFDDGVSKVFSTKSLSKGEIEFLIKQNMKENPGVSREAIIEALNNQ